MPRLTFALVVHGEQAYLDECTSSLLSQDFVDVELVVVDDASPDHAPELLDELAARDPRVRVRRLEERVGLGAARNLVLEMAEGDYVWFVHTTDLVRPGALAAVARRLRAGEPDVLLVHHVRTDPLGRSRPGPHKRLLSSIADRGTVTLDEEPGVADAAPRAWNKVLRRALLEELGVRFGEHGHGELTVTWPALLSAERIAAAPAAAYIRRRPANAVRDRFVEGTPFDLFAAHDAVHAWLADPGRHAAVAAIDAAPRRGARAAGGRCVAAADRGRHRRPRAHP
jgi:CDP-glycerol glycerophosphotransferase